MAAKQDTSRRSTLERSFEEMLVDVLTQDHDLDVRRAQDPLDRRRNGVASLQFDFHWDTDEHAKVVVTVEGVDDFSNMARVDFRSEDTMAASAEDCEALALFLTEHLSELREDWLEAVSAGELEHGRREDDWY